MDPRSDDKARLPTLGSPSLGYVQHVLVVLALAAGLYLVWLVRDALLIVLAGVIVAVLLAALAAPIERRTRLKQRTSVVLAAFGVFVMIALVALLMGAQLSGQFRQLTESLPEALSQAEERLGIELAPTGGEASGDASGGAATGGASGRLLDLARGFVGDLSQFGFTLAEILAGVLLVAFAGVFLALDPDTYRRGLVALLPERARPRVDTTLGHCGVALLDFLKGALISMTIIGVLAGLGTWALGLPAPLALGVFAGLTEFVPIVGPVIGAIPALVLAAAEGGATLLWTALLFIVIQQVESNLITPFVQKRMVSVPPALFLFSVFAFGLLFGTLGVIVAAPLTVVAFVMVKELYVRGTLDEETEVPGEGESGA